MVFIVSFNHECVSLGFIPLSKRCSWRLVNCHGKLDRTLQRNQAAHTLFQQFDLQASSNWQTPVCYIACTNIAVQNLCKVKNSSICTAVAPPLKYHGLQCFTVNTFTECISGPSFYCFNGLRSSTCFMWQYGSTRVVLWTIQACHTVSQLTSMIRLEASQLSLMPCHFVLRDSHLALADFSSLSVVSASLTLSFFSRLTNLWLSVCHRPVFLFMMICPERKKRWKKIDF